MASTFSGQINLDSNTVGNTQVMPSAGITVDKTVHQDVFGSDFGVDRGTAPSADVTKIVHYAMASETITDFRAALNVTGSSTDVKFDLYVNGSSVLSSTVDITHSTADATPQTGTISSATLTAGDQVALFMDFTSQTGASGPWAQVTINRTAV